MKNRVLLIGIVGIILILSIIFFVQIFNKENKESISIAELENSKEFDNMSLEDIKKEFNSNNSILQNIPKKFYMMPEFYPNFDRNNIIRGVLGYGAYPGEATFNVSKFKTGQYIDVYTLVLSSYGVYSYQGLGLEFESPSGELFKTTVEPSEILLSPLNLTDPMSTNWVYKIRMMVIAKKDIPDGRYLFRLKVKSPSAKKSSEFMSEVNASDTYVDASMIQTENFFDFMLNEINENNAEIQK